MENSSQTRISVWMSPSQLTDYLSCPRKWWFRRVPKLPEEEVVAKWDYGHQLHEVCERYVAADDRGRDATGQPVDLFPPDWNDKRNLSRADCNLIKVTVEKAMEGAHQVLRRMPGRETEVKYKREVIPDVQMVGMLDVMHNTGFEDHKSSGRRWRSSQKSLAKDEKMLCYAYEQIIQWWEAEGKLDPDRMVNMRFNYFSKDHSDVFVSHVDVDVRASEVVQWWEDVVVPAAEDMLRMKNENLSAEDWSKVEGPRESGACGAYGGCKYAHICTRVKKPSQYIKQIDRINESRTNNETKTIPTTMSVFSKTKKRKGGTVTKSDGSTATASKQPRKGPGGKAKTKAKTEADAGVALDKGDGGTQVVMSDPAPWARKGCKVCEGSGMHNNEPCGACNKINGATGGVTSNDFEIVFTETHLVYAGADADGEILLTVTEVEEIPAKPQKEVSILDKAEADASKEATEAVSEAEAKDAKKKARALARKAKRDAKKAAVDEGASTLDSTPEFPEPTKETVEGIAKEFDSVFGKLLDQQPGDLVPLGCLPVLYINCLPIGTAVTDLSQVLLKEGADLAKELGKENYFDLVAYERRSQIASHAEEIFSELRGAITVGLGDADLDAFTAAIRPFFSAVVVGTR